MIEQKRLALALWAGSQILLGVTACSHSQDSPSAQSNAAANQLTLQKDALSHYDPASLVEVKQFSELPEGLKVTIRAGKFPQGATVADQDPGGYRRFAAGGASKASALVAYDVGDYVPQERATAYVYLNSQWVIAREWNEDLGFPHTLSELLSATGMSSKHSLGDRQNARP
jgi:hypothetical protein